MKLWILLAVLTVTLLPSCSMYPLGHSRNGDYFGGQGSRTAPGTYVPRELQREQEIF